MRQQRRGAIRRLVADGQMGTYFLWHLMDGFVASIAECQPTTSASSGADQSRLLPRSAGPMIEPCLSIAGRRSP